MRGPDVEEMFKWLLGNFGGERARMKDKLDGVRYSASGFSTVWILVQKGEATPTQGKAIDHIGWRSETSLTDTINGLKAKGVTVTSEPRPLKLPTGPPINFAYVAGTERRAHRARRAAGAEAGRVRPRVGRAS